jgi:hypothetical protein
MHPFRRISKNPRSNIVRIGNREIITRGLNSALVFFLGHEPIANVPTGSFMDLFYFSIETLATVGYGDMHPQTHFGHAVACAVA